MGFLELLSNNAIEEWIDHYINYNKLQSFIENSKLYTLDIPNNDTRSGNNLLAEQETSKPLINDNIIKKFESLLTAESRKVNKFYLGIEEKLISEYEAICQRFKNMQTTTIQIKSAKEIELTKLKSNDKNNVYLEPLHLTKSKEKKQIFSLYERLIALSNFASLNKMGFEQIMNAFYTELEIGQSEETQIIISEFEFLEYRKCSQTMNDLVIFYANQYENGDIDRGKIRLFDSISWSVSQSKWQNNNKALLCIGLKLGIMIGAIFVCITLFIDHRNNIKMPNVMFIYRSFGVILALIWFWSFNVYIFSKYRINFMFIFGLNPRTRLNFIQYCDVAATLTILYFLNIILCIETYINISKKYAVIWPDALFIFVIFRLFLPCFDNWQTRKYILQSILQCVIAPFGVVRFRDFFIGDVLTSLSKVFVDLYMSACVLMLNEYETDSVHSKCVNCSFSNVMTTVLIVCPYWFRFMQCINRYYVTGDRLPNGFNALKYGLSISVTLMSHFHANTYFWFFITLLSSMYSMFWDIRMDWNLFPWSQRIKSYPKWWYFIAVPTDIVLRLFWTFTLFPNAFDNPVFVLTEWGILIAFVSRTFYATAEVFRRCVWALFRVEKAHNGQKEEFRKYKYMPLFLENNTLIKDEQTKSNPLTLIKEIMVMLIILLVLILIIVLS